MIGALLFKKKTEKKEKVENNYSMKEDFRGSFRELKQDLGNALEWFFGSGKYEKMDEYAKMRNQMYSGSDFFGLPDNVGIFSSPGSCASGDECQFICPHAESDRLVMTQDAYKKMLSYAYFANKKGGKEVGMIMVARSDGIVHEIHMPKQTASSASFSFDAISAMEVRKYINNGENFVGWAHSHSNLGPFLSGTDIDNIETLLEAHPKIFSVVTNARGETRAWVHCKLPCGQASVREIPINLVMDKTVLNEEIKLEVEQKLSANRFSFPLPGRIIEFVPTRGEMV